MTIEECLHVYTPVKGDKGYLCIGSVRCAIAVKVVSLGNEETVALVEKRPGRGRKRRKWVVPDWHHPFEIDGKKAVFIDTDGYFRVEVNEGLEVLANVSKSTIGEKEED